MPWRAAKPAPTKRPQGAQSRTLDNEARDCLTTNFKIDIIENIVCARIMNVAVTLCAASTTVQFRPQNWHQNLSLFFCYAHKVVKKNNYIHAYKQGVPNRKRFQRFQMSKGATCPRYFTGFSSPRDVTDCKGFKSFQGFGSTERFKAVRRVKRFRSVEDFENPKATKV